MQPFITYREPGPDGRLDYFILQKEFPHFVGRITYAPIAGSLCQVPLSGHSLWVIYAGTLRGNMLPNYRNLQQEIDAVYTRMALWFYENRIVPNPKKYQQWQLKAPSTN